MSDLRKCNFYVYWNVLTFRKFFINTLLFFKTGNNDFFCFVDSFRICGFDELAEQIEQKDVVLNAAQTSLQDLEQNRRVEECGLNYWYFSETVQNLLTRVFSLLEILPFALQCSRAAFTIFTSGESSSNVEEGDSGRTRNTLFKIVIFKTGI